MRPPGTSPPAATMSRICGCSAPGVAICSAADPLSPCAQMLPSAEHARRGERAVVDAFDPPRHFAARAPR